MSNTPITDTFWLTAEFNPMQNRERDILEAMGAIERENAELRTYTKNGVDCFMSPCKKHSGENTPPYGEFMEKYGKKCTICLVDENAELKAKIERMSEKDQIANDKEHKRVMKIIRDANKAKGI